MSKLGIVAESAAEIVKQSYPAAFYEDFLDCIFVPFGEDAAEPDFQVLFGKNGDTWGADIEDGIGHPLGCLVTEVSSASENPAEIAAAIVSAIRHGNDYRIINNHLFTFNPAPADDSLFCDECGADVLEPGCWSAEIEGHGAAGIMVLCKECIGSDNE